MQRYSAIERDTYGNPASGVVVTVTDAATGSLSTLYLAADNTLDATHTIANPIVTDASGLVAFAVPNGRYTLTYSGSSITPRMTAYLGLYDNNLPTATVAITNDTTTNATHYPIFGDTSSGSPNLKASSTKFNFNPSTGALTATSFVKSGGTSAQFLKADGTIDSSTYMAGGANTIPKNYLVNMTAAGVIGATAAGACTELLSGGGTTNFLRADGTWAAPASGGTTRNAVADANYTVSGTGDQYVEFTSISATRTVTLPAANGKAGQTLTIKDQSGSVSASIKITVTRAGADTLVPGSAITSFDMVTPGSECVLVADGTSKWTLVRLSRQVQTFTSGSTTWTAPPGVYSCFVDMCAGGGGGCAGTTGTSGAAGGGGGGQIVTGFPTVVPGTGYSVTIGGGGSGGASAGAAGVDGSDTTFGALLTAKGGSKGPFNNSSSGYCAVGAYAGSGGKYSVYSATDGTNFISNSGIPSFGNAGYQVGGGVAGGVGGNARGVGGAGGAANTNGGGSGGGASIGNGGAGGAGSAAATGTAGTAASANTGGGGGGGGGGATSFAAGGAGGSGVCVVQWWV